MKAAAPRRSWLHSLGRLLLWLLLAALTLWVGGALFFDFPIRALRGTLATLYLLAALAAVVFKRRAAPIVLLGGFAVVFLWWQSLAPSNQRDWQADVAQSAWAEIYGERVTIHNFRNCDYRTETDYSPRWETRVLDLGKLRGLDLVITYWGSKWMAHPIVSFQFDDALPICFSIEVRLEQGEQYSSIGGLYRHCELIYVCADERDVVRLRSNFRQGEEVYLYRTTATPAEARQRFVEYLTALNSLHTQARWYNAVTTNCTTSIRAQRAAAQRAKWDRRILLNGYMDEMLYEHGALAGGLPFAQLKELAHINAAARAANDAPDFSQRIRAGRPGFGL